MMRGNIMVIGFGNEPSGAVTLRFNAVKILRRIHVSDSNRTRNRSPQ